MAELEEIVANAREKTRVEAEAGVRYSMGSSAAGIRKSRYERLHQLFAPVDGDQWPMDRKLRPNKLHITANIVRAFCITEARLLSILPRVTNKPPTRDTDSARRAEALEELFMRYLEASGWDVWMFDRELSKSIYGRAILKAFWNDKEKRPDVQLIEQPQNLLVGYGTSDYSQVDWAIYRYAISDLQAKLAYPDIHIEPGKKGAPPKVRLLSGDHTDPILNRDGPLSTVSQAWNKIVNRDTDGDYERTQVEVWDYWYLDAKDGTVCNAILVGGCLVKLDRHEEMPTIPYLITEHDHEPGSAEGIGTAELLTDIQLGLNRVLSHYAQLVADNSGTAYQLNGDNADSVPENIVPREDEIIPAGAGNSINPIQRGVNPYPIEALIERYWDAAHKITGLPDVLFGAIAGTQTSGRSMAVQIEAAQNRIDPKRRRSYEGLRNLFIFWGYMLKKRNPTVSATQRVEAAEGDALATPTVEAQDIKIGDLLDGFENWQIIAPEITPRDAIEQTTNVISMIQAKLIDRKSGMDMLGIENPEQIMALIEKEQSNASIEPGAVQAKLAAMLLVQQIEQAQAAQAANASAMAGATEATMQRDQQAMTPAKTEDMNGQPTAAGGAPAPGAPAPTGELLPIIRQTPTGESQAMSQVNLPPTELGL